MCPAGCGLEPSWNKNGRVAAAAAAGAAPVGHWCGLAPGAGGCLVSCLLVTLGAGGHCLF